MSPPVVGADARRGRGRPRPPSRAAWRCSRRRPSLGARRSVRGGQRLGALDVEDGLADRDRALARLGAQQLEAELVVGVALAQLRAAVEARLDALRRRPRRRSPRRGGRRSAGRPARRAPSPPRPRRRRSRSAASSLPSVGSPPLSSLAFDWSRPPTFRPVLPVEGIQDIRRPAPPSSGRRPAPFYRRRMVSRILGVDEA